MTKIKVTWDLDKADIEEIEELNLPDEVNVPDYISDDEVADYLSDQFGWLVEGWNRIN